ncbi:hypothetical protein ACFO4O_17775 [Glaciecola siphonariae]|uniref:DUF2306 domain-containing protein n=1 Tax=Glaciecola siphonariae TaxID=521012 RepID=A0ABV9M1S7_9ALTE
MTYIHSFSFVLHIIFGAAALMLFWVPVFTKKGQLNHRRFGHFYKTAMYGTAATGVLMASLVLAAPLVIKHEYANAENAASAAAYFRYLSVFLLYLALLTFTTTRHGIAVLRYKAQHSVLRRYSYIMPIWLLAIGGVGMIALGIFRESTLYIVFGVLGCIIAVTMLRYCYAKTVAANQWIFEHIGSIIGSGIGAYTAFLTFGARTFFSDLGQWQLVFWIAPGVVGGLASYLVCKKYAALFTVQEA